MRLWVLLLTIMPVAMAAAAPEPGLEVLADFEAGVTGWLANPWGGGQAFAEPAPEARFGQGALQARYVGVERGANVISPYFPPTAPWRQGDYDRLVFWLKGDGTNGFVSLILETGDKDKPLLFSTRFPLDSTRWRRCSVRFSTLWNREGRRFHLPEFLRLYFGCTGTHTVLLEGLALQRPLREVPLEAEDHPGPAPAEPRLLANREGQYFLTFDPKTVAEDTVTVELTVAWPGRPAQQLRNTIPALAATGETWLLLPALPGQDGDAGLSLQLREPDGDLCYRGKFTFPVVLPSAAPAPGKLQLVPQPKETVFHPGRWTVPPRVEVRVAAAADLALPGARRLARDLAGWFGREVVLVNRPVRTVAPALVTVGPPGHESLLPTEVRDRTPGLREQGYVLHVHDEGLVLAALDEAGMRYAVLTALQVLRSASPSAAQLQAPCLTLTDWPSLPVRAVSIGLPTTRWGHPNNAPVPVDFFLDFLRRNVVDLKYNVVCLEILNGMKYDRHPELAGPAAYTKDEVRRLVSALREEGVEVIPQVEALGHADWLVIWMPQFQEEGDTHTLCTRHPEIRHVLTEVFDEVREVFRPARFHMGLDEIRWPTLNLSPEKRCPRCRDTAKSTLFAEHVAWLHEYCGSRGMEMLAWADMLLPDHNGGSPFYLDRARDKLPRSLTLCDWSTSLAPLSLAELAAAGFPVWKSNSRGAHRLQHRWITGNMWGVWSRVPWLVEAGWPAREYCYLNFPVAAEYSWNPYPDLMADTVPLEPGYFARRPLLQSWLAADPVPAGGAQVTSLDPGPGQLAVAEVALQPFPKPVTTAREWPLAAPAAALYLLLAASLPADQASVFREQFQQKEHWRGIPIGEVEITYADGQTVRWPVRYGTHVRAADPGETFPQAAEALGQVTIDTAGTSRQAYLVQWANPRPEVALAQVRFMPGDQAAMPILLGLAWRERWTQR